MRWDGVGQPQALRQGIGEIMIIEDVQSLHFQACLPLVKVNLDGVVFHLDHPEHVVGVDMHVVVMNLLGEHCRSGRTGVQIKSNKGERTLVLLAVRTDELALAEAHVRLVR